MKKILASLTLLAVLLGSAGCGQFATAPTSTTYLTGGAQRYGARKLHAVVQVPAPGSFVVGSLNTAADETIGVASTADPTIDVSGVARTWVDIPTGGATFQPDYSLSANAYAPRGQVCTLLAGTDFAVAWDNAAVGYGPHVDGTGVHEDFDAITVTFGGATRTVTNAERNVHIPFHGATLTVNDNEHGINCLTLQLPSGDLYMVAGVRP